MASEAISQAKAAFKQAINLDMVRMDKVKEITKSISLSKGMSLLKDKAKSMAKETAAKALKKLGVTDTLNMAQSLINDFGALKDDFAETFLDLTSPGSRKESKDILYKRFLSANEIVMLSDQAHQFREAFACSGKESLLGKLEAAHGAVNLICDLITNTAFDTEKFLLSAAKYFTQDEAEKYLNEWIGKLNTCVYEGRSEINTLKNVVADLGQPSDARLKRLLTLFTDPLEAKYAVAMESGLAATFFSAEETIVDPPIELTPVFGVNDGTTGVTLPERTDKVGKFLKSLDENIDRIVTLNDGIIGCVEKYTEQSRNIQWDKLYQNLNTIETYSAELKNSKANSGKFQFCYRRIRDALVASIIILGKVKLDGVPAQLLDKTLPENVRLENFSNELAKLKNTMYEGWGQVETGAKVASAIKALVLDAFVLNPSKYTKDTSRMPNKDSMSYEHPASQQPQLEWQDWIMDRVTSGIDTSLASIKSVLPVPDMKSVDSIRNFCRDTSNVLSQIRGIVGAQKEATNNAITNLDGCLGVFNPRIPQDVSTIMGVLKSVSPAAADAIANSDLGQYMNCVFDREQLTLSGIFRKSVTSAIPQLQDMTLQESATLHAIMSYLDGAETKEMAKQEANDKSIQEAKTEAELKKNKDKAINKSRALGS